MIKPLAALLAFALSLAGFAHAGDYGPKIGAREAAFGEKGDFAEVRRLSRLLLEKYSPERHLFIGIGRSPVSVIAFLQVLLGDEAALNFPLSGMGKMGQFDQVSYEDIAELEQEQAASMLPHFLHFLPAPQKLNGREIVLIDFAGTGKSLVRTYQQTLAFYQQQYPGAKVSIHGLGLTYDRAGRDRLKIEGLATIQIESDDYADRLIGRAYRDFAEYHQILSFPDPKFYKPPQKHGSGFQELKEQYRLRLQADACAEALRAS